MTKKKILSLTAVGVAFVALLLSVVMPNPWGAQKEELTVSAAISLKESFTEIGAQFEKEHPGVKIVYNYGASGQLAQQIQDGAPADIFASAATDQMDKLVAKGLVDKGSVKNFATNRLVVIALPGNTIHSFSDLSKVERLAIGDPQSVPAGKYAMEALTKAQLYDALETQHKLVFGQNVRQVLVYVEGGNVSAGIVYNTDAATSKGVVVCFAVPGGYTQPIVYPIGRVKASRHKKLGQEFVDFVNSPYGRKVLQQKGFLP